MKKKTTTTWFANIWIAGDYTEAVRACEEFCRDVGLCVTVTVATYVYTGGSELGVCVRLINYPRFAEGSKSLRKKAELLAEHLRDALSQQSYSIEFPKTTVWVSNRPEDR